MNDDLSLLINAAKRAGDVARSFVGGALDIQHKPDDLGPVTAADLAVNALLEQMLRDARPDYGWLSEESLDDPRRLSADRAFIVDPIDGTRSFIEGSNSWAHSIAVTEFGKPVAGVVFLPMRDLMYTAASGQGAFCNGRAISPSPMATADGAELLTGKPSLVPELWKGGKPDFKRAFRSSLAYRLGLSAQGRFDGMLSFRRTWEWDIAAGAIIVSEAGGVISDVYGNDLTFNKATPLSDGVLAAGPDLHASLLGHIVGQPPA